MLMISFHCWHAQRPRDEILLAAGIRPAKHWPSVLCAYLPSHAILSLRIYCPVILSYVQPTTLWTAFFFPLSFHTKDPLWLGRPRADAEQCTAHNAYIVSYIQRYSYMRARMACRGATQFKCLAQGYTNSKSSVTRTRDLLITSIQ